MRSRPLRTVLLALLLLFGLPAEQRAHEIPEDVTIHAFVRAEGDVLRFLVRVPLYSMRDVDFPLRGPGWLDIEGSTELLDDLVRQWIVSYVGFEEDGRPLGDPRIVATRIERPSDRSFESFESALANVRAPMLPSDIQLPGPQALLDVLLEYDIASAESDFSIRPDLAHLGVSTATVLRFQPPGGTERAFRYESNPGLVELDPSWWYATSRFIALGFWHILGGLDHILFLLCLVIPFRRFWGLVPIVTGFTVAHSITLIAAALGMAPNALWFAPLIETLIAASIVWMALENIFGAGLNRRWGIAFAFGLVHGFGFSFLLSESLQFAGSHLLSSLLAFNIGVELGQLALLAVAVPALGFLYDRLPSERMAVIVLSALVGHTGWHWMTERGAAFLAYDLTLPAFDLAFAAQLLRWLMLALIVAGAAWGLREGVRWWGGWTAGRADPPDSRAGPVAGATGTG
ncbi:MAG TPA: HupE/UreJ family protein [Longimicrobiales bacterium]|nr:HupE/UreJ family protein [Longimicrobiales bacterium]